MERITWINKRASLLIGKRTYKDGDIIPVGVIPDRQLERLVREKKIRIGEPKKDMTKKEVEILGAPVVAQVVKAEPKKPVEPEAPMPEGDGEDMIYGMLRSKFIELDKDEKKRVKAEFKARAAE